MKNEGRTRKATELLRRVTAKRILTPRDLQPRRARVWLAETIQAIEASGYRRDRKANLIRCAGHWVSRARPGDYAVLYRREETAAALRLSVGSVKRYRQDLIRLGRIHVVREGVTALHRGVHHPDFRTKRNSAAVLALTASKAEVRPPASSVEEECSKRVPYARGAEPDAARPGEASTQKPPANAGGRRGRSQALARELRAGVPELQKASVAAIATELRKSEFDAWSCGDLRHALALRPGHQPWFGDGRPVLFPVGWMRYRLRAWRWQSRPGPLRAALDALSGGRAAARRAEAERDRAETVPPTEAFRAARDALATLGALRGRPLPRVDRAAAREARAAAVRTSWRI